MTAIEKLREQQAKVKERSPQWMVAEQLIDICRNEPQSAELLEKDLDVKEMSIIEAEKKIKAFADKRKTGNFACVTPAESDSILRKFYGLPESRAAKDGSVSAPASSTQEGKTLDLMDFLR